MLIILVCAILAAMTLWPQTPAGRFLRRWVVEAPARKLTPGVMIFGTFLLLAVVGALLFMKSEGMVVLAQAPEAISWFAAFDIGTYIDVIAVAWLLAATVRLQAAGRAAASALSQVRRRVLARVTGRGRAPRRARRPQRHAPPPADDGRSWGRSWGRAWTGLAYA
jgi:hypothetical protein